MNRRTFLKAIGLAIAAPGAVLGAVKAAPLATSTLFGKKILEANERFWQREKGFKTITIDGKDYYIMMLHPQQFYALKVATARNEYKHKRWLERHNHWLAKQGKPPIWYGKPELGVWDNVRIIEQKAIPITVEDGLTEDDELKPKDLQLQIENEENT